MTAWVKFLNANRCRIAPTSIHFWSWSPIQTVTKPGWRSGRFCSVCFVIGRHSSTMSCSPTAKLFTRTCTVKKESKRPEMGSLGHWEMNWVSQSQLQVKHISKTIVARSYLSLIERCLSLHLILVVRNWH